MLARGGKVKDGYIVVTGSVSKMVPAKPGKYLADYGDFGTIKFEYRQTLISCFSSVTLSYLTTSPLGSKIGMIHPFCSVQKGGGTMIYELRTYTLYPGKVPEFLETLEKGLPVREKYSKLGGLWYTETGELNQVVHLWPYEDLAHRAKVRQAVAKDPEWQKVLAKLYPIFMKMESKILIPADFSPIK